MKAQHARVKLHGRILDLQAIFELVSQRFARYVIEEKLEKSFNQGADTILLAGGGWVYMLEHIRQQYPNRNILHPERVPHLRGVPLWELNAYGALPMSAANKKVNRRVLE
jgi:hypothetical protein